MLRRGVYARRGKEFPFSPTRFSLLPQRIPYSCPEAQRSVQRRAACGRPLQHRVGQHEIMWVLHDQARSTPASTKSLASPAQSTTTRMAQDDVGPVSGIRHIQVDSWRGSVPHQGVAISEMASPWRSGPAPSTTQAPAACREGTGTHSRTSDGER